MPTMHGYQLNLRVAGVVLTSMMLTAVAVAQPEGPHWEQLMKGPGMMMGPAVMGPATYGRICSPGAAGFAEWQIGRIGRMIKSTDAQRAKLDELKAASDKALDLMRIACPRKFPTTNVERMAAMEGRLETMLAAVKAVRPALEALYATLTDEQKVRLDRSAMSGRLWGWRNR